MTSKRFYFVMIVINVLVVASILATAYLGNTMLKKQSTKLQAAKTANRIVDAQQTSLNQAKKDIEKYKDLNEIVKSIVPQDKDQAQTIREITKIASESGVSLKNVTFQSSTLGQIIAPKASTTDTSSASKTATPPSTLTQVKPIDGIKDVFALEIVISNPETQPISYTDFINFLQKLETNRRTANVDKILVKPTENGKAVSFTLTLNAYVKP